MQEVRSQSAMEYLMTYGWAILIIAVVLGALFGLGFFNSAALAPKVSAGSCQVYRPYGPSTTSFINFEGTCNNELPQYVAQFGGGSYISTSAAGLPLGSSPISIFAWVYPESNTNLMAIYSLGNVLIGSTGNGIYMGLRNPGGLPAGYAGYLDIFSTPCSSSSPSSLDLPLNQWSFVGITVSSTAEVWYLDNQNQQNNVVTTSCLNTILPSTDPSDIGKLSNGGSRDFVGQIENVQVYNTSLSANEVTFLYDEGIGGVPLNLNNLVAWWPLNGNANDYSGNLNNGVPTSVIYTSSWTSGYTAP